MYVKALPKSSKVPRVEEVFTWGDLIAGGNEANVGQEKSKSTKIETLVGTAMEIQGDLIFSGGLHVDGKIVGNVIAEEDSHSMLVLSDQGQIEGEVRVPLLCLMAR